MTVESNRFGPVNSRNPRFEVKENVFLYLIFFIDENHKGRAMIAEAAQTRLKNIKRNPWYDDIIHKAFCIPIQSVDEILDQIPKIITKHSESDKKKVIIGELGVASHAGTDGPISYNREITLYPADPNWPHQMSDQGWGTIAVEWASNARFVFYGCNTGNTVAIKNFAKNISSLPNFKDVAIWGQLTSSFPSFYPDFRVTSVARNADTGWNLRNTTYMVGGNKGRGFTATSLRSNKDTLTLAELASSGHDRANPLNCYKNGANIQSTHQGVFNNHR
jgi:hypothetical protein